jgi:hypothetical protein
MNAIVELELQPLYKSFGLNSSSFVNINNQKEEADLNLSDQSFTKGVDPKRTALV